MKNKSTDVKHSIESHFVPQMVSYFTYILLLLIFDGGTKVGDIFSLNYNNKFTRYTM
jgi:hypothetical protein